MKKKKTCWLQLYQELIQLDEMPYNGLCSNLWRRGLYEMEEELSGIMKPSSARYFSYWADPNSSRKEFTPLRQNIVLLMAAMAGEL